MTDEEKGKQLLTAVERLVSKNASLRATVAEARARVGTKDIDTVGAELIRTFSNRAAIAGGAAGLPSLIPGIGSLVAGVAGVFAELAYLLKTEVELCLTLSHLYGFDIDEPRERQLAFLMASVGTSQGSKGNVVGDLFKAEGVAIWNYAPRQLARMVLKAMSALALARLWAGLLRMVPLVGIGVGATMNKVLTQRVGARVMRDLKTRRELFDGPPPKTKAKRKLPAKPATVAASPKRAPKLKAV